MLRLYLHVVLVWWCGLVNRCLFYHGTRGDNFSTWCNFISRTHETRVFLLFCLLLNVYRLATARRSHRLLSWMRLLNSNYFVTKSFFVAWYELTRSLGRCTRVLTKGLSERTLSATAASLILVW